MTKGSESSQIQLDPWDQPTTGPRSRPPAPSVVRDDWEDDDDDDENNDSQGVGLDHSSSNPGYIPPPDAEENRKIWEAANDKVVAPMPTLLASRTSSVVPPPAAAFQPALRILRRPQSSSPSQGDSTTSPPPGESLQEREARYAAARERIFGAEALENGSKRAGGESRSGEKPSSNHVKILREPKAPEPAAPGKRGPSSGFKGRGGKPPPSPRPPAS